MAGRETALTASHRRPFASQPLLSRIGGTPLVRLQRLWPADAPVAVYLKLEGLNPGGSVKDRPALYMVADAIDRGLLGGPGSRGRRLLDATSGNTGIAYAMIGAALGLPVTVCLPENASPERQQLLRAYGARICLTEPGEGTEGARAEAARMAAAHPDRYLWLDQYNNFANPRAHLETTGPEIWEQTGGRITHFVAGAGTGGTLMGTGQFLKAQNPHVRVIGVQPDEPLHGLEGLKHMESAQVPGIYDASRLDQVVHVNTEVAYRTVWRLAREEGILTGGSAGAATWAAVQLARTLREGVIVAVAPDNGDRYLATALWKNAPERPE